MTWTTELAAAMTAENAYRQAMRGSMPCGIRFDGRGAEMLRVWISSRAAAAGTRPASDLSYWANCSARAVTNMGPSWSVVQNLMGVGDVTTPPAAVTRYTDNVAPFGFVGPLDGLFEGLVRKWAGDVWAASSRTSPSAGYPADEFWTYLFGSVVTAAGVT